MPCYHTFEAVDLSVVLVYQTSCSYILPVNMVKGISIDCHNSARVSLVRLVNLLDIFDQVF